MFYHHLSNLPGNSIAGEVFQIQKENNEEGILAEFTEHLLKIGNPNPLEDSKRIWRNKISKYIAQKNRDELLDKVKTYKKLSFDELSKEKYEKKSYFTELDLENVQMNFKIRSKVVPTIRKNFPSKYRERSLTCQSCKSLHPPLSIPPEDSQSHLILECPAFENLREGRDMMNPLHLAEYFRAIVQHRMDNNID